MHTRAERGKPPPSTPHRTPPADVSTAPTDWTLADVVDFELMLAEPPVLASAAAGRLSTAPSTPTTAGPSAREPRRQRRALLLQWLHEQRKAAATPGAGPDPEAGGLHAASPGQSLVLGLKALSLLALAAGAVSGIALAAGALAYPGSAPVNAPLFWALTVGWQIGLWLLLALVWVWHHWRGAGGAPGVLQRAARLAALWLARLLGRLPGAQRDRLRAWLAQSSTQGQRLGPLLASATLMPLQRFGLAFNAGLLLALLALHLPFVDLRFGWQSSYPVDAAQVHGAVRALAWPWARLLPVAVPDLAQVAATRFSPGQSADTLPADAARAWWPFLAMSIACWGLALRALMLAWTRHLHRRQLAALAFDQPAAMALWRQLQRQGPGPLFDAQVDTAHLPDWVPTTAAAAAHGPAVALIADELSLDASVLQQGLQAALGWSCRASHALPLDDRDAAAQALEALRSQRAGLVGVAVLAPAERDPIVAVAQCLRAVREAAGSEAEIRLLLLDADAERLQLWQRFMQIQRLPIGVQPWPSAGAAS